MSFRLVEVASPSALETTCRAPFTMLAAKCLIGPPPELLRRTLWVGRMSNHPTAFGFELLAFRYHHNSRRWWKPKPASVSSASKPDVRLWNSGENLMTLQDLSWDMMPGQKRQVHEIQMALLQLAFVVPSLEEKNTIQQLQGSFQSVNIVKSESINWISDRNLKASSTFLEASQTTQTMVPIVPAWHSFNRIFLASASSPSRVPVTPSRETTSSKWSICHSYEVNDPSVHIKLSNHPFKVHGVFKSSQERVRLAWSQRVMYNLLVDWLQAYHGS